MVFSFVRTVFLTRVRRLNHLRLKLQLDIQGIRLCHFQQPAAESGKAVYPEYPIEVLGEDGLVVARVLKTLYVRKKKPSM